MPSMSQVSIPELPLACDVTLSCFSTAGSLEVPSSHLTPSRFEAPISLYTTREADLRPFIPDKVAIMAETVSHY